MRWLAECSVEALGEALRVVAPELVGRRIVLPELVGRDEPLWRSSSAVLGAEFVAKFAWSGPRHARVGAADRAHAVELILRAFALGQRVDATAEEANTVERVLGIAPRGRRQHVLDAGPWLTGPAEDLFDAANVVALPTALQALGDATEAELETARHIVAALFWHLPLMARMMAALFDEENYAGLAGLRQIDQHPEIVMLMVPSVIGMLRAGWQDNLQAIAAALSQMPKLAAEAHSLLDQPNNTIEANLSGQPADEQQRARRIIRAAIDGDFDQP
jgi:hypothetical protein